MVRTGMLLAALVLTTTAASAQIVPCSAVSDRGTKILLDDIVGPEGTENLLQSVTSRLDANLAQVEAEIGVDLKVLPCARRRPSGPSDFLRPLVQELNVRDVLMEVWGVTTELTDPQGQRFNEASIGYMLVPVRLEELESQHPPGAFIISHRAAPSSPVDDLMKLVDQAGRLGAYAALAIGSKSLRSARWDASRKQLCAAEAQFRQLTDPLPNDTALAEYAKTLAADAVTKARADARYTGFLKQEGVPLSCAPTP